jgi:TPP-dependent 2-oxoacid decarboxylase
MQYVTSCCKGEIVQMEQKHYPLGDRFYERLVYDGCNECGEEVEEVLEKCDCCGDAGVKLTEVHLGHWCGECLKLYSESLVDQIAVHMVKAVTG